MLVHLSVGADNTDRSIETEVTVIRRKQDHGKGRQLLESTQDQGDVIKRYRRIESLFRQLQVSRRLHIAEAL